MLLCHFFSSQLSIIVSIVILCTIYLKLMLVKNDIPLPPWGGGGGGAALIYKLWICTALKGMGFQAV